MKRILSVRIKREVDTNPDTSHFGEYANNPKGDYFIDRQERGDMGRREYRYFNTSGNYQGKPQADIKRYTEQDYERMESYNRGSWHMIGIWADAQVALTGNVVQTIRSGGLWGIESDSYNGYLVDVEKEQLDELAKELTALGFTKRQIDAAFEKVKQSAE